MNKKINLIIYFNNLKGLEIYKKINKRYNIIQIVLSKKNLNNTVLNFLKLKKKKLLIIKKFDNKNINYLKKLAPDINLVCGFPLILPNKVLSLAKFGNINCHSGPLPKYRGGSPLNWQIINNEKKFGISIIKMNRFIDQGDIIIKKKFNLKRTYDINDLHKIANKSFIINLPRAIKLVLQRKKFNKQKNKRSSYFRQRKKTDGIINWDNMSSLQVFNLVRALKDPYPNAYTYLKKNKIRLLKVKIVKRLHKNQPGEFIKKNKKILVKCNNGCIEVLHYKGKITSEGNFSNGK